MNPPVIWRSYCVTWQGVTWHCDHAAVKVRDDGLHLTLTAFIHTTLWVKKPDTRPVSCNLVAQPHKHCFNGNIFVHVIHIGLDSSWRNTAVAHNNCIAAYQLTDIYHALFVKRYVDKNNWNIYVAWNNASKQHTVGYSKSQQVFKVFSFGLRSRFLHWSIALSTIACLKSAHTAHTSAIVAMETASGSQQH